MSSERRQAGHGGGLTAIILATVALFGVSLARGTPGRVAAGIARVRSDTLAHALHGGAFAVVGVAAGAWHRQRRALERLHEIAHHDPLTGLPNRLLLTDRLVQALARRSRGGGHVAVLTLDLDRFKSVNDTFGHPGGDELLTTVAHRLHGLLRPSDTLARTGGDEFIVVCDGVTGPDDVAGIAARMSDGFARPFAVDGQPVRISVSIGIALTPSGEDTPDGLLAQSDRALYRAKQRGGGQHAVAGCDW